MNVHHLKCWPAPFSALISGSKTHEIRRDDRDYQVNDVLVLREWHPTTEEYCGREARVVVTYVTRGPEWGIPVGLAVLSVRLEAA